MRAKKLTGWMDGLEREREEKEEIYSLFLSHLAGIKTGDNRGGDQSKSREPLPTTN